MRRTIRVVVATSVVLLSTAAIAQQMPADVPAPKAGPKKPAFVAVSNSVVNKVAKFTDAGGTVGETTNIFESAGRLGIGTSSPQGGLHIFGAGNTDVFEGMGPDLIAGPAFNYGYAGASFGVGAGFFNVRPAAGATGVNPSLRFATKNLQRMIIAQDGKVGIGPKFFLTPFPAPGAGVAATVILDIDGDINMSGNINAKYQDVAEWVDSKSSFPAGTVVILDSAKNNGVAESTHSYDTTVAGVVSARPGIVLGEAAANREKIATSGRVKVYVDATVAPIRIGDLLVTSDTPGMAMRSEPMSINGRSFHQPGTIIGKALEPLASGKGEILVLLTLQ